MATGFDAYHKWLSIPPSEQPPNHYRLLGLGLFETDPDVIAAAADRQMAHVQTYKTGPHSALSQQLLNEIAGAKLCLLRPQKKTPYDEQLRRELAASPRAGSAANGATAVLPKPPVAPPPPALAPPVHGDERPAFNAKVFLIGTAAIAILLIVGIVVVVLGHGSGHPSASTTTGGEHGAPPNATVATSSATGANSANNGVSTGGNPTGNPPLVGQTNPNSQTFPPTPQRHDPPQVVVGTNPPSPSQTSVTTPPKNPKSTGDTEPPSHAAKTPAATASNDHGTKPTMPDKSPNGSQVATAVPSGHHPAETEDPNPFGDTTSKPPKTVPVGPSPTTPNSTKPANDPTLAGKTPVPDQAATTAVEQRLGAPPETTTPAELLEQAHKGGDAAEVYVQLRRALDSAVKHGDAATAISASDELGRRFAINSLELRMQTLEDLALRVSTPEAWDALANAATALVEDAMAANASADVIEQLNALSLTAARKSANVDTVRKITLRIVRMRAGMPPSGQAAPSP